MMEWDKLYDALSKILTPEELKDFIDRKAKLDQINYQGIYDKTCFQEAIDAENHLYLPKFDKEIGYVPLKPYANINCNGSPIVQAFHALQRELRSLGKEMEIGVISNGVHSIDLLMRYFSKEDISQIHNKEQQHKRVMILYEAPANNLAASAAYLQNSKAVNPDRSQYARTPSVKDYLKGHTDGHKFSGELSDCLTGVWWRLDLKNELIKDSFSGMKKYAEFLIGFIRAFGMIDIYTTNLFRFEIFRKGGYDKADKEDKSIYEVSLGWDEVYQLTKSYSLMDIAFDYIVKNEITAYQPDIILATSKPYQYLQAKVKDFSEINDIPLYKIPHPASMLATEFRECVNICHIAKALQDANIITLKKAVDIIEKYYLKSSFIEG